MSAIFKSTALEIGQIIKRTFVWGAHAFASVAVFKAGGDLALNYLDPGMMRLAAFAFTLYFIGWLMWRPTKDMFFTKKGGEL